MEESYSSEVGGDVVLPFIMTARAGGGWHTLSVEEAEAKMEVGANSEEVKLIEDKV